MSMKPESTPESDSRRALQRLLIVLAIVVGALIYSYGWAVTEIDLSLPQEERRQENVTRALRELLSPHIFDQEREVESFSASILIGCDTATPPEEPENMGEPMLIVEPTCAEPDDVVTVRALNMEPGSDARLRWVPPPDEDGEPATERPLEVLSLEREEFVIDGDGNFTGTVEVPRIRGGEGQLHDVRLLIAVPAGPIELSETAELVIDRMVQTIFMALVATTVAIPIAALISFFAARNLMRRVRLSVGTMLLSFTMLVLGFVLGNQFVVFIGQAGLQIGQGDLFQPIGVLMAFVIPAVVLAIVIFVLGRLDTASVGKGPDEPSHLLQAVNMIVITLTVIFIVGAIGGLGILGGEQITALGDSLRPDAATDLASWLVQAAGNLIWSLGNILLILGTLVELFIGPITGAITAFALSGLAGSLFGNRLRRIKGVPGHILGGILGAISGAMLMAIVSMLGLWAALFGLLPVFFGGLLGGQVLLHAYRFVQAYVPSLPALNPMSRMGRFLRQVMYWVGFVIVAVFLFDQLNLTRSLVDGTLPPQTQVNLLGTWLPITHYTFVNAMVGAVLAGIIGLSSSVQGVFPLGNMLYNTSRTILNIVRSIEPLIMGLVFVIWVGIGPFAGVLALTLHSIAALGKLYSEQIENIDPGPLEALQSTGANQLQTIIYSVVPQIVPPYIAFTMYRWDINVRMSTIIGFVGGGGIGLLLQQQINLLRYSDAGVAVLAIALVVSILDYLSASIRERLT